MIKVRLLPASVLNFVFRGVKLRYTYFDSVKSTIYTMSSRSKKKQSQTVQHETVTQSTPSTSKTTPGRGRPPSPTTISRAQEKNELANLNDRLAAYIDRVRFLEGENSRLSKIIQTQEETVTRETSNIKGLYESELADARRLLDETAKERAELSVKLNAAQAEAKDFKDK